VDSFSIATQQWGKNAFHSCADPWQDSGAGRRYRDQWGSQDAKQRDNQRLGAGNVLMQNSVALRQDHVQRFLFRPMRAWISLALEGSTIGSSVPWIGSLARTDHRHYLEHFT
jgi:hypothetical protein